MQRCDEYYGFCKFVAAKIIRLGKMGKIEMFVINFDKPNQHFYGGEIVSGRVLITCRERMKIKSLYIDIVGQSRVHW